jgi:hypothetical protein
MSCCPVLPPVLPGAVPCCASCSYNRVIVVATGEPVAPRASWSHLTQLFLATYPEAYFYHITAEYAQLLHDMGYWINGCGTETTLQVCMCVCSECAAHMHVQRV